MSSVINNFLNDDIINIQNNINLLKLNNNNINNKLIQKKIEYISFYFKNILQEIDELNIIINNNLFYNHKYVENEINKYKNMENTIQYFQFIHNL